MQQNRFQKTKMVKFRQWSNKSYAAFNSLHKVVKICTLALAYSMVAAPAQSQSKSEGTDTTTLKTMELDEVTVQSTLIDLKAAETGRSIDVISGAQLQSLPVTTIDELLRYIPGIDAQQRGAFGAQTDFSLRGSNFNQVLVLIDGQKINDPLTAHFNSNIPISPSEIERIEVIHGPASLEYGPDATGGVINILTKTFSKNQQFGTHADAKLSYGQHNLVNSSAGAFYGTDKFRVSGGGLYNKSDGNTLESGLKGFFDIRNASVSGQYQINNNWSASYRYANDFRYFNAANFYTDYKSDKAIERVKRQRHQFQLIHADENYTTKILASYVSTNDYYKFSPTSSPNDNSSGDYNLQVLQQIKVSPEFTNVLGATADRRTVVSTNRGTHALNHLALFATVSVKPIEKIVLNGGIREDFDQNYGHFFLPQVSASYKVINPLIIRAAWGRSVRAADFTENYNDNYKADTLKTSPGIGNRNLLPEKSWNTELGFDLKIVQGITLSTTYFNRMANDIIDYIKFPGSQIQIEGLKLVPTTLYYYAQNSIKSNTNGVESRISVNRKIEAVSVNFTGGYTILMIDTSNNNVGKYAMLQPSQLINGNLSLSYGPVLCSIDGLYKVRNKLYDKSLNTNLISSYTVWNTNVDIALYKNIGFLTFSVYNVFNKKYSDFLGAEMPGRWISGGLKFKI